MKDLSFDIPQGAIVGVVGERGGEKCRCDAAHPTLPHFFLFFSPLIMLLSSPVILFIAFLFSLFAVCVYLLISHAAICLFVILAYDASPLSSTSFPFALGPNGAGKSTLIKMVGGLGCIYRITLHNSLDQSKRI